MLLWLFVWHVFNRAFMLCIRYGRHTYSKLLRFIDISASYPSTYSSWWYSFFLTIYSKALVLLLLSSEVRLVSRLVPIVVIRWYIWLHSPSKVVLALSLLVRFSLLLRLIVLKKLVSTSCLLAIHCLFPLLISFFLYLLVSQGKFLLKLFF